MAILIRFYTAILKKEAIESSYPGGLARFLQDHPGVPQDEHLVGVPFMSGGELQRFVYLLRAIGFDLAKGYALGEMMHGECEPCSGIDFRASHTNEIFPEWHVTHASAVAARGEL